MNNHAAAVGERLRRIRMERRLSLAHLADRVGVSVATLSRVETSKQNIDVSMLVTLASVLDVSPGEILGERNDGDDADGLKRRLARLPRAERTRLFLEASRVRQMQELSSMVDDLIATLDVLREELAQLQKNVRKRRNGNR